MDSLNWQKLDNLKQEWLDLVFRHSAGMEVDRAAIETSSQAVYELARKMALSARDNWDAWLILTAYIRIGDLTPFDLDIHKQRQEHLAFEEFQVNGRAANDYSKYQYLNQEPDPARRHAFLCRLMEGHPAVDEAFARYRNHLCALAEEWHNSPLDAFLLSEGLSLQELRAFIGELAGTVKPLFLAEFERLRWHILGDNQGEPWEDLITFLAGRWSALAEQIVPEFDAVAAVRKTARTMGFDPDVIQMDLVDRPYKRAGASAWYINIPDDIRLMVKPKSRLDDPRLLYHEMGHALHFSSIDPELPFPQRYGFSSGVAETFSFWFNSLLCDPLYLTQELGFGERAAAEMARLQHFIFMVNATWMSAESLCLLDYWTNGPLAIEELGRRYSKYMQQCTGLKVPPAAIRPLGIFIHQLNLNGIGFGLAFARLGHLLDQLEQYRRDWWCSPDPVATVRAYMRGGRYPGFAPEMLDITPFVNRISRTETALPR